LSVSNGKIRRKSLKSNELVHFNGRILPCFLLSGKLTGFFVFFRYLVVFYMGLTHFDNFRTGFSGKYPDVGKRGKLFTEFY